MATLDELKVVIKADGTQLQTELKKAAATTQSEARKMQAAFGGVNSSLRELKTLVATYFGLTFVKGIVDTADRLNDLSNQTGVTVEALSELSFVAKLSGTNIEALAQGMKLMGRNVSDAAANTGTAKDALKDLNISAAVLNALPLDQQFEAVAEALSKVKSSGDQVSYAMDIMGRSGAELLPAMQDGAQGIRELREQARAMGVTLTSETAQSFAALNDQLDMLKMGSDAFSRSLLETLVPALNDVVAGINELLSKAPSTSAFFNSLGAAWVGLRGMTGLDPDIVDEALLAAGENTAKGQAARNKPAKKARGSAASTRRASGSDSKAKEAEDYDTINRALDEYLENLETERELAGLSGKALAEREAILKANGLAIKEGNLLSDEQRQKIVSEIDATYDLTEATRKLEQQQKDAAETSRELRNQMTDGLTDIVLHFDNATDAAGRFFEEIASQILKKKVTGPLADGIGSLIDTSSFGKMLGFADGGSPPVGVPSIVGERGPEIFVPRGAGTIVPNHALGGGSVSVTQNFNMSPGLQGTVEAEVRRAAPSIMAATKAAVFASIERGGPESRSVNRRS